MLHGGDIYSDKIEYDFSVNLNPNPCPDEVRKALLKALGDVEHYPDPAQRAFREAVARSEGVDPSEVAGGNGASELFMAIVNAINPERALLVRPCFYGYEHALGAKEGCFVQEWFLREDEDFELGEDFLQFLDSMEKKPDLLFLANPNNPTGRVIEPSLLRRILEIARRRGIAVVLDECFGRMAEGAVSAARYVREFPNLYVVNAYTKLFSIPGVRVGYVVTDRGNMPDLLRRLPEWNLSVFAGRAGVACAKVLGGTEYAEESRRIIASEREYLGDELRGLGLKVEPSDANFILFRSGIYLFGALRTRKILIRDCGNFRGLDPGFYRAAVKSRAENRVLIKALKEILKHDED